MPVRRFPDAPRAPQALLSRRGLLRTSAAAALLGACGYHRTGRAAPPPDAPIRPIALSCSKVSPPSFDLYAIPEDLLRFPLGVQAGAMRPTSVLLSARIPDTGPVWLYVWAAGGRRFHIAEAIQPDPDGFIKVALSGLEPGKWVQYALVFQRSGEPVARSTIGRVRAALAPGALQPVTIALAACNGRFNAPWPTLLATARHPYDILLHLGDMAYNDHCWGLQSYRESWWWHLSGAGVRAALSQAGLYTTWDDHEVANNWNPETISARRLAAAVRTHREALPLEDGPLWRSYRWGSTVEIFLLDSRGERRPSTGDYLSAAQWSWLERALSSSPCRFRIIANSVPITNMPKLWDTAGRDRWEGFPQQRLRLLERLRGAGLDDVLFVSGDFHSSIVGRVEPDWGIREIVVTSGNTNPLARSLARRHPEQFDYSVGVPRVALLTLDPAQPAPYLRFIQPKSGAIDWEGAV